ncbi:MAG: DUF503 domain-containing protein [Planctomycetota bacterium]
MFIGILQFELSMPWSRSLKDKRSVVKSLKDRLHREHMVSIAEVAFEEIHNRAVLGVVMTSNSGRRCGAVIDRIVEKVSHLPDAELVDVQREIIRGQDVRDELIWEDLEAGDDQSGAAA